MVGITMSNGTEHVEGSNNPEQKSSTKQPYVLPPGFHIKLNDFCQQLRDLGTKLDFINAQIAFFAGQLWEHEIKEKK